MAIEETSAVPSADADEDVVPSPPIPLPWPPLMRGRAALRPWGASDRDAAALAGAWAEPDISRWTAVPEDHDEAAAARWIGGEGLRRDQGLAVDFAIAEPGSFEVVLGEVGLVVVEPSQRWAEVGYWLFPGARGAGRAASALTALSEWALADLGLKRLFARVHPDNPPSAKVAERADYEMAGELPDGLHVWVRDTL